MVLTLADNLYYMSMLETVDLENWLRSGCIEFISLTITRAHFLLSNLNISF